MQGALYKLDKLYLEIYVYKYTKIVKSEAISVKESRDEDIRGFGEKKREEKMLYNYYYCEIKYYNLKNKK